MSVSEHDYEGQMHRAVEVAYTKGREKGRAERDAEAAKRIENAQASTIENSVWRGRLAEAEAEIKRLREELRITRADTSSALREMEPYLAGGRNLRAVYDALLRTNAS